MAAKNPYLTKFVSEAEQFDGSDVDNIDVASGGRTAKSGIEWAALDDSASQTDDSSPDIVSDDVSTRVELVQTDEDPSSDTTAAEPTDGIEDYWYTNANIVGSDGDDVVHDTSGNDVIVAGAGNDYIALSTSDGTDEVYAGAGNDTIAGGSGYTAVVSGGLGDDAIFAGDYEQFTAYGGQGFDTLFLNGTAADWLLRFSGDEQQFNIFFYSASSQHWGIISDIETLRFGDGSAWDTRINVEGLTEGLFALTPDGSALTLIEVADPNGENSGTDQPQQSIQEGTAGNDEILDTGGDDIINAYDGDDLIKIVGGVDTIYAGDGNDTVTMTDVGTIVYMDSSIDLGAGDDTVVLNTLSVGLHANILGGEGTDTFVLSGNHTDYRVAGDATGTLTITNSYQDDSITISGIEKLTFADGVNWDVQSATVPSSAGYGFFQIVTGLGGVQLVSAQQTHWDLAATMFGTNGADEISAADTGSQIAAGAGADTIQLGNGTDTVDAGGGDDLIVGSARPAYSYYGTLTDNVFAGDGNDTFQFTAGNAQLLGEDGNDTLILGGTISDYAISLYGEGSGEVRGLTKSLQLSLQSVENIRFADGHTIDLTKIADYETGVTYLIGEGDTGAVTLSKAEGPLSFTLIGTAQDSYLQGGEGNDTIFTTGKAYVSAAGGNDTINIENGYGSVDAGNGDDTIIKHSGTGTISGGNGNDTITTSGGGMIYAGDGDDVVTATDGWISGDSGYDTINLAGNFAEYEVRPELDIAPGTSMYFQNLIHDVSVTVSGFESFAFADRTMTLHDIMDAYGKTITATNGPLVVGTWHSPGWYNNSTTVSGWGNNKITGGDSADRIETVGGDDTIAGGGGNDVIHASAGDNVLSGGDGNDYLTAMYGNDIIDGGVGNDIIYAGSGDNSVSGGAGDDMLTVGTGHSTIDAGAGNDRIYLESGSVSEVTGGAGNDDIIAWNPSSTAVYSGSRADYDITEGAYNGRYVVNDLRPEGDGRDTIDGVAHLKFADGILHLADGTFDLLT